MTTSKQIETAGNQGHLSLAGEGQVYQALGTTTILRATHVDTGGSCEVIESVFPPQGGVPPHLHRRTDESVYVLDGEITIQVGERTATTTAGAFVYIPRGTIHAFQNTSAAPCKVLIWAMPAFGEGMKGFLDELNRLPPGPPDMGQLMPLLQKYDMEIVAPTSQ